MQNRIRNEHSRIERITASHAIQFGNLKVSHRSPVEDPPNDPKEPPVEEPGDTPNEPPPTNPPPMEEPPNEPEKPPVKEPPSKNPDPNIPERPPMKVTRRQTYIKKLH
jgi:hypothetical protein